MKIIYKKSFYLLALFPLFNLQMVSIGIILFLMSSLLGYNKSEFNLLKKSVFYKPFFLNIIPFVLCVFSLLWTENISYGLSSVERSLSLLIFPLIIFILKPISKKNQIIIFIKIFILSSAGLALWVTIYVFIRLFLFNEIIDGTSNYVLIHMIRNIIEETPLVGEHPIYFSLIEGLAIVFFIFNRFKCLVINIIVLTFLIVGVFLASSKGPLLALFIVLGIIIFMHIKSKSKAISLTVLFFGLITLLVVYTPLNTRFKELTNTRFFYPKGIYFNSFNTRVGIYACCVKLAEEVPFYGIGEGDVQNKLNGCYDESYVTSAYDIGTFNSHNQYFHFLLSYGLLGFSLIMITFVFFLREAWFFENKIYICFLIFFFINFLFENLLSRNTGVVLFSMFNCMLYFLKLIESDNSKR